MLPRHFHDPLNAIFMEIFPLPVPMGRPFSSPTQTYMAPWLSIFGDFTKDPDAMYNNFRVYGTGLLLVMGE
jgi:hypothetical protein